MGINKSKLRDIINEEIHNILDEAKAKDLSKTKRIIYQVVSNKTGEEVGQYPEAYVKTHTLGNYFKSKDYTVNRYEVYFKLVDKDIKKMK